MDTLRTARPTDRPPPRPGRRWPWVAALLVCPMGLSVGWSAAPEPSAGRTSLEDRLTTGLQVRRPADAAYIGRVVELVEEGKLPAKLVDSTFLWAVRRRQRHPLPAFREALRLQADRIGVEIE
ncbi:MAG: hypothetical protein EBR86_14320 [Planctomycetia bacterium]|nr:hypothetical protein [Planctomycetia bacterium]